MAATDDLDLLARLAELQGHLHAGLLAVDEQTPVPACPGWSVGDLGEHVAGVHAWAEALVRDAEDIGPPRRTTSVPEHYARQAARLHRTLSGLAPQTPVRTMSGTGPAAFWRRRQTHETLVHLHDLHDAADTPLPDPGPQLWADAVDEVVAVLHPRQLRLQRAAAPEASLQLESTDVDAAWRIAGEDPAPAATLRGPARDLALLLWRRLDLDAAAVDVAGDARAARRQLSAALTP